MTDRPGATKTPTVESPPPLDPSGFGTTWIVVAAGVIGVLTVLLLGTTVAVTKSGPPDDKKAASTPAETSSTPSPAKKSAAAKGSANIRCDGSFIVELARSTTPSNDAEVEKAAENEKGGKFLDANASCERYKSQGVRRVAYVGPF